jgi:putative molybdopterin biosynthesis protein
MHMPDLLNTEEAAAYLRLSERKLHDLVAANEVPCTKATGRWLFPKADLDRWLASGAIVPLTFTRAAAPAIVGGSQDPLLEWALRESGSGLASLPEGSERGLARLRQHEVIAAAIHLHRLDGDDESANLDAVADAPGLHDAVVIAFARREQGLLVAPRNPKKITDLKSALKKNARLAQRPDGAGAQLLLLALLNRIGTDLKALKHTPICPTGPDLAQAIRSGHADCGLATRGVAASAGLDFIPLAWERFDLVLRQRDYFLPPLEKLFAFLRTPAFRKRAQEMTGYDISETGRVRLVN